jgi:thiol-disulfide isomerase/thioredoxin
MRYLIKPIFFLLFSSIFFFSCDDEKTEGEEKENNFSVSGIIKGAGNALVTIEAPTDRGVIEVAKTETDASGKFELRGNVPGMGYYVLRIGSSNDNAVPITLVPQDQLKINAEFSSFTQKPNASGTSWAKGLNGYMTVLNDFRLEQEQIRAQEKSLTKEQVNEAYLKAKEKVDEFVRNFMEKQPDNPYNIVLSMVLLPTTSFDGWNEKNLAVLEIAAQGFEKSYPSENATQTFRSQVDQISQAFQGYKAIESGTIDAPEISLPDVNGKTMNLSDLRGKVVLVDFWASWCGPCRKENPNVVKLYKKYKSKGFTVLSVSLDEDPNKWKEAIAKDGLEWNNHVSDLMGWNSKMPQLYGFEGIPFTVLVNKEGKIIGRELRGEQLEQKLKNVFGF